MSKKLNDLIFDGYFTPPSKSAACPERNCEGALSKNDINNNPRQAFEEIKQLDNYTDKSTANQTHYEVGKKVRETIKELGGTMPEDLPTPLMSVSKIEKSHKSLEEKNL